MEKGQEALLFKGHTGETFGSVSPDGKWLASASNDGTARLWDVNRGQEALVLKGHIGRVETVAFSPDGKRLVTASAGMDQTIRVWDVENSQEPIVLQGGHRRNVF